MYVSGVFYIAWLYNASLSWKCWQSKHVHNVVNLSSVGNPREVTPRGPRLRFRNVQPFLDCLVLMLCHRPVREQTHMQSCSALTLSLVSSSAEVRGNMLHFLTQVLTVFSGDFSILFFKRYIFLPRPCLQLGSTLYMFLRMVSKKLVRSLAKQAFNFSPPLIITTNICIDFLLPADVPAFGSLREILGATFGLSVPPSVPFCTLLLPLVSVSLYSCPYPPCFPISLFALLTSFSTDPPHVFQLPAAFLVYLQCACIMSRGSDAVALRRNEGCAMQSDRLPWVVDL